MEETKTQPLGTGFERLEGGDKGRRASSHSSPAPLTAAPMFRGRRQYEVLCQLVRNYNGLVRNPASGLTNGCVRIFNAPSPAEIWEPGDAKG